MKHGVFGKLTAVIAVCVIGLTGCSLDVESFLQPPRAQGEQKAVQTALETTLRGSGASAARYTLQYPVEGAYTSAFVLCDAAGMPVDTKSASSAQLAVAFYKTDASDDVHVHLLRRNAGGWISVADRIGFGAGILQVAFGDLDGDGRAEMCTGWDTYNSRDHRLAILSPADNLSVLSDDGLYTRLFVGKLDDPDKDSLLLLRITDSGVSAVRETLRDGKITSTDTVVLDRKIRQFDGMTLCRLADGINGLYVDAVCDTGTRVTELIYADGNGLHAPFCDPASHINTVTQRPGYFPARDVDGDAVVDIPVCWVLPGYEEEADRPDYAYGVRWRSWDYDTGTWTRRMTAIVHASAGYRISLDEEKSAVVTTEYDEEQDCLILWDTGTQKPFLRIRPASGEENGSFFSLLPATGNSPGYEAWFDPEVLDRETVRYMVSRLNG